MKHDRTINAAAQGPQPSALAFAVACTAVVFVAYAITFVVARNFTLFQAAIGSAANTIPTVLFGLGAYWLVRTYLVVRNPIIQAAGHLAIGAAFSLLAYWLITVLLGIATSASVVEFTVRPFPHPASTWQLLQNFTTYGIFATLAYVHVRPASASVALPQAAERTQPLSRYFIKSGDDFVPMDVDKIVSIAGADDYCEVATLDGRHLAKMTLAEFEQALDPTRFIRIHRSRIVSVQHVQRAEPAGGGRLLVHMANGESIPASRTGSKRLREMLL
jgi:two-component system LytT family response regulator